METPDMNYDRKQLRRDLTQIAKTQAELRQTSLNVSKLANFIKSLIKEENAPRPDRALLEQLARATYRDNDSVLGVAESLKGILDPITGQANAEAKVISDAWDEVVGEDNNPYHYNDNTPVK
ncbi:hypothetical protein BKH46_08770 [Helicobacter sp. 12S02634-8]|uniref:hypothetical protein n=1 Tax=Helicobacter sp. 12S02634-8 TaxID=1476199 RepID=UPI000BA73A2B|nr:hypothetical protein [Helicobacter sp. 12S02634-8]PAF46161.1 hypothetical protein BKH46_08770 [Helicobacter sp. 12S02634-8]